MYGEAMRRVAAAILGVCLTLGLGGCLRKKTKVFVPPTKFAPVALLQPATDSLPLVDLPDEVELPVPIAASASHPRPKRKLIPRTTVVATPNAPAQVANTEGPPDDSAIGELTAGGTDANPQRRQEAGDLIDSNEKRLKALSGRVMSAQRSQVSKIRNFQRQAKLALDSGDAEGAMTLATKARLLLYDLDRGGGG